MKIAFPSREFDEAVAAVCHGLISDGQAGALNELLRSDTAACDEYLLRVELHARLASHPDFFSSAAIVSESSRGEEAPLENVLPLSRGSRDRPIFWALGLAACAALLAAIFFTGSPPSPKPGSTRSTSKAVAMLNRTADARWNSAGQDTRLGAPLEPGWLRLESGLAQVVFYTGARVVIEGPAEIELISANEALCKRGRIVADIPPQARGFRIETPQVSMSDTGTSFGLAVEKGWTELHVFEGIVQFHAGGQDGAVREGSAALIANSGSTREIGVSPKAFASLFDLREKSVAAQALRHQQWRVSSERINRDPSLIVHFDFESLQASGWQIRNLANHGGSDPDAVIVGCRRGEGRWPEKRSLEFQSVSDRVRLNVPGEFDSLTLTAWISVKGLDRKINSLFMCDGFERGTIHWLIRNDGVPGLTVIGAKPGDYQIVAGPPVVTLDKFGMWQHLAVTVDGNTKRVVQYLNGVPVDERRLRIAPPFRIGAAELGNWNAKGFPEGDPFMIRNFSGAIDEFCLFSRALDAEEIRGLYSQGKPQCEIALGALNRFPKQ